jgi:ParB family chromosome partitioning protein
LTQQDISTRIGKSRTAIANTLRLLKLPSNIRSLIVDGIITPGHGRCILSIEGFEREKLLEKILKDKLSVRDSERLAQKLKSNKEKIETQKKELNSQMFLRDIEDRMQKNLGTKVVIKGKSEKGKIEIEYYSNDDLERLTEMLSN